jgi:hypothetical protein
MQAWPCAALVGLAPPSMRKTDTLRLSLSQFGWTLKLSILAAALVLGTAAPAQQKSPQSSPAKATTKSACNQISDAAKCKADATCSWIAALTDSKTGKQKRKAYCRTKSKPPAKKAKAAGKS